MKSSLGVALAGLFIFVLLFRVAYEYSTLNDNGRESIPRNIGLLSQPDELSEMGGIIFLFLCISVGGLLIYKIHKKVERRRRRRRRW
jgi:hypothetical protein